MVKGGYHFEAKNDVNARRGLYISLAKNTTTFHKLPNGNYGLVAWYPAVREQRSKIDVATTALLDTDQTLEEVVDESEEQIQDEKVTAGKPKPK
jgi:hypothetical protein